MLPLSDSRPSGIFPFWTIVIIGLNVFVFFLEITATNTERFISHYALIPAFIDFSHWETLTPFITSQFLHGGFLHIASNMWFLWIFGDNVEGRLGFLGFPIFYLLAGIVGGLLQYIFVPSSTIPMIGASGAIAGVLGAYYAIFPRNTVKTLVPLFGFFTVMDVPASIMLFYWLFTQIFSGVASITAGATALGGVAWFAHIGGFATGWFIGHHSKR